MGWMGLRVRLGTGGAEGRDLGAVEGGLPPLGHPWYFWGWHFKIRALMAGRVEECFVKWNKQKSTNLAQ